MNKFALASLFPILALASPEAGACSMDPPLMAPPIDQLVLRSDLIMVARIERIEPITKEEAALTEQLMRDPPINVSFRFPTGTARFSAARVLKGALPANARLQNGATNCDVTFVEDRDFVVFANKPDSSGDIVPLYGTFLLDISQQSRNALAEVESLLSPSESAQP